MCHGEGSLEQLDNLPRSISLSYMVEEARRREQESQPPETVETPNVGDYRASLQTITNHRKPIGMLTVSQKTSVNRTLLIPVADRSGSMGGSPTQQVQYSLKRVVDLTFQNQHLRTSIIHYDDVAESMNILPDSFRADHYKRKIDEINARGGTYFRTAFTEIVSVIGQHKSDPLISSVIVVFLTDGQDSCADRASLVEQLRTDIRNIYSGPFTVHTVGFSRYHDFPFLDALRKAGTTEGAYRFADPSEDLDSLSNKINSVLDVVARDVVNPIQLRGLPESCSVLSGANGKYFVTGDLTALSTVGISSQGSGQVEVPVEIDPVENDPEVIARWHTNLLDEISGELIPLSTQAESLDRDLHCQLIEKRLRAIQARLHVDDEKNRSRLTSIREILEALVHTEEVSQQRLQDLRFEGTFSTQRGQRPPPPQIQASIQNIPSAALIRKPASDASWPTISLQNRRRKKGDVHAFWQVLGGSKTADVLGFIRDRPDVLSQPDAWGRTPLMMAVSIGRVPVVEALVDVLLASSGDINHVDKEGFTACDLAVLYGYHKSAEILLRNGAVCQKPGATLLRTCVSRKFFSTGALLLRTEISKITDEMVDNVPSNEGFLWLSERQQRGISLERAITKGLLDVVQEKIYSIPPLSVSWQEFKGVFTNPDPSHLKIVDLLLREGKAHPHKVLQLEDHPEDHSEQSGTTSPLFLASEKGHAKLVQILTSADADIRVNVDWRNHKGTTALWIASCNRHIDVVEHLLNLSADPNIPNHVGDGPLIPACQKGNGMIVELLVNCGARLSVHNPERDNPVLICCRHNQPSILETLLQSCTYEERQDFLTRYAEIDGFPPLHAATELGHHACLPVLHNFGADLEWRTSQENKILPGATALHLACHYGRLQAMETLVSLGADIMAKTSSSGLTALHIAVKQGHRSLINYLLSHEQAKALATSTDSDNRTPNYYASPELNEEFFVDRFSRSLARILSADAETVSRCSTVLQKHSRSLGCFDNDDITNVRFEGNSDLLSWAYLCGKQELVETLVDMGASHDTTDNLGIPAQFWKEYFRKSQRTHGDDDQIPENVRVMLDRVANAKKASVQNRSVLLVKPAASLERPNETGSESYLVEKMNEGFGDDLPLIPKPDSGPVTLLGFLSGLPKSKEVTAVDWILWDAKVNALKRVASGLAGPLSAIQIIAVYLYTSNPEIFRKVNSLLHEAPPRSSLWPPFVQCLYQALLLLPGWEGEAYRAVESNFDPETYRKGRKVSWNSFSVCTQEWRKVSAQLERRTGVVFIIRTTSAREVHPYSKNAPDREVILLPGTSFVVGNYYKPNILCLGQANIREITYSATEKDVQNAARGTACLIVELHEVSPDSQASIEPAGR
jgi:ankyrin repeat protein/Mg-chelatase subunit ChlD